jgi:type 1 glutamine amidotransferase
MSDSALKINAVVLTGGHDFDEKSFPSLFAGYDDIRVERKHQKDDSELFEDISDWKYNVVLFYNMGQKISPKRQENFLSLLDRGVGVVALHHCIAAYGNWPEWSWTIGGRYFSQNEQFVGNSYSQSLYKHDVSVPVHVEDPNHPITRGLKDYTVMDETYKGQWVDPQAHILLTTQEATSDTALAWCKTSRRSRVCYIQLGHGPKFDEPNYRQLVSQAIRWTAEIAPRIS